MQKVQSTTDKKKVKKIFKTKNQSMLNAHVIEITKACVAAFMKARNSLVISCKERKKTEDSENVFFQSTC